MKEITNDHFAIDSSLYKNDISLWFYQMKSLKPAHPSHIVSIQIASCIDSQWF